MNKYKEDAKAALEKNKLSKIIMDEMKPFVGMKNTPENREKFVEHMKEVLR